MRSSSLARVVMAGLGASAIIAAGCGGPEAGPSPLPTFSVGSIAPYEGSTVEATAARIAGTGFPFDAVVTVDGSRVDATFLNPNTISLTMPAHAAGTVNVTAINPRSQAQASVPGGFSYIGPPVIGELTPNTGSTAGGLEISIIGTDVRHAVTVTVDGMATPFEWNWPYDEIYLSTPPHAPGTVEVIVTNRWGQAGRGEFTYASPATFDFNGEWQGVAQGELPSYPAILVLTIRDNLAVSVSCAVCRPGECAFGSAPSLTLDPPPVVANGEFSFAGSGGVSITGAILSPNYASGSVNMPSCVSKGQWTASKR